MNNSLLDKLKKIYSEKKYKRIIHRIFFSLAGFVVFLTSYFLILPAITAELEKIKENNINIDQPLIKNAELLEEDLNYRLKLGNLIKEIKDVKGKHFNFEDLTQKQKEKLDLIDQELARAEKLLNDESASEEDYNQLIIGLSKVSKDFQISNITKEDKKVDSVFDGEDTKKELVLEQEFDEGRGEVRIKDSSLSESSELIISPIRKKTAKTFTKSFFKSSGQGPEAKSQYEKLLEKIKDKIKSPIDSAYFYDISIYNENGDYQKVDNEAFVSLDLKDLAIREDPNSKISIIHFTDEKLIEIDPELEKNENNEIEKVSFKTNGFSVFAVIKHLSWTEARLPEDEYTIITPIGDGTYKAAKIEGSELVPMDLAPKHFKNRLGGEATERPFEFRDEEENGEEYRNLYSRFKFEKISGNRYTIKDEKHNLYLAIDSGVLNYQTAPYDFFLYRLSDQDDKVMIFGSEAFRGRPQILVLERKEDGEYEYKLANSYEFESNEFAYHQFIKNRKESYYRKLSQAEITNLEDGKYAIVAVNKRDGLNRSLLNEAINEDFDSIALKEDGDLFHTTQDGGQNRKPYMWTIKKTEDNPDQYFIQDQDGKYLKIDRKAGGVGSAYGGLVLVDKSVAENELQGDTFRFEMSIQSNGQVRIMNLLKYGLFDYKLGIGLRPGRNHFYGFVDNSRNNMYLAVPHAEETIDTLPKEEDLVEAIIPEGEYFITNEDSTSTADSSLHNYADYIRVIETSKNGDTLIGASRNKAAFRIIRQKDGKYLIAVYNQYNNTNDDKNRYIRLSKDYDARFDYYHVVLDQLMDSIIIAPKEARFLKIMTLKSDPTAFYIYNKYGSLNFYPWKGGYYVGSKVGALGNPLRLYKVTDNKLFTHQENTPTEKLAHITDGDYIIGNNPNIHEDFLRTQEPGYVVPEIENEQFKNEQDISTLPENGDQNWQSIDARIHYNEKANNVDQHHTIEEKPNIRASEWKFTQTDKPGYYTVKNNKNKYLGIINGKIELLEEAQSLTIYQNDKKLDQILITQGNYRLRFDGTWKVVANSEPLTNADYHFVGKKIDDYFKFELTNPDTEKRLKAAGTNDILLIGGENHWLNNVRLMKSMWAKDLITNEKIELRNNEPKGYFEELGPIGQAYKKRYPGEPVADNPFKNLYRMDLMDLKNEDFEGIINNEIPDKHYKEYKFVGWKVSVDGKDYIIDKNDASFEKKTTGIEIAGNKTLIEENGELQINPNPLIVPYGSTFKTIWQELSAPIYFNFINERGVLDIERHMSAGELLNRENAQTATAATGILASGRLFFPEYKDFNLGNVKAIKMDDDLNQRFNSIEGLDFKGNIKNQININYIIDSNSNELTVNPQPLGKNALEENALNWIKETTNKTLSILRIINDENKILKVKAENTNVQNYGINLLDIKENASGNFLKGIVYGKTREIVVEKHFNGLTDKDINKLMDNHKNSLGNDVEGFNIKVKVEPETENFYKLIPNKNSDPEINLDGASPVSYNDLEGRRVSRSYNNMKKTFRWAIRLPLEEEFKLIEENFDLKNYDEAVNYNIFTRIQEYKNGVGTPTETFSTMAYGKSEAVESNKLRVGVNGYIRFNNLYSNGGVILITKKGRVTQQLIRGAEFSLYKTDTNWEDEREIDSGITGNNGTIAFKNLAVGNYILKEKNNQSSLYKPIDDFKFSIEESTIDGKVFYKLIEEGQNNDVEVSYNDAKLVNKLLIYNELKEETLIIKKNFNGIERSELDKVLETFEIKLTGESSGETYSKILNYENSNIANYGNQVIWYVNTLDFGEEKIPVNNFAEITLEEKGYEHSNYPVVKRRAFLNDIARDIVEYPYKLSLKENENNTFQLDNIYTDTFELVIEAYGRDRDYSYHIPIKNMGFQLYGSKDEANPNHQLVEKDVDGEKFYLLEKPRVEGGPDKNRFLTDKDGYIKSILNLAIHDGNKYAVFQSDNPSTGFDIEGIDTVYYPIEKPFIIKVGNIDGNLNVEVDGLEVKGEKEVTYQNGLLYIRLRLDRTNYRLPETGGIGKDVVNKVAMGIIFAAVALLIYRKKYKNIKIKGEN